MFRCCCCCCCCCQPSPLAISIFDREEVLSTSTPSMPGTLSADSLSVSGMVSCTMPCMSCFRLVYFRFTLSASLCLRISPFFLGSAPRPVLPLVFSTLLFLLFSRLASTSSPCSHTSRSSLSPLTCTWEVTTISPLSFECA